MRECPNCHATLPDPPERFCPSCGVDLAAYGAAPPPIPPAPGYPPPGGGYAPPPYGGGGGGGSPWERRGQIGFVAALIETTKEVLSQPTAFFRSMPVVGGMGGPLLYAIIVGYVGIVASTLYNVVFRSVLLSNLSRFGAGSDFERFAGMMEGGAGLVINLIFGPVLIVIGLFISAGIFHLVLLALGGATRGFEATFRVACYSHAASLFNVVPGCGGLIGLVYAVVLLVIGLSEAHGTTRGKAAAAVLVPLVLVCCCCGAAFGLAMAGLAGVLRHNLG